MRSQALRNAARRWNHVNIFVAIIFAGEGDHRTIGRKHWIDFNADVARQPSRFAALALDHPQVSAITERDVRLADRRLTEKSVWIGALRANRPSGESQEKKSDPSGSKASQKGLTELLGHGNLHRVKLGNRRTGENGAASASHPNNRQKSTTRPGQKFNPGVAFRRRHRQAGTVRCGFRSICRRDSKSPFLSMAPKAGQMVKTFLATFMLFVLSFVARPVLAQAPATSRSDDRSPTASTRTCAETPGGKTLLFVCPVPAFLAEEGADESEASAIRIVLKLPEGTALRIAIDQRARVARVGEAIEGHVVETVYAFDEAVIPAGTIATGRVTYIAPVSKLRRAESYANGDFSPFHRYEVTFDRLTLPDGRTLPIDTTVSRAASEVVHLVSKPKRVNEEDPSEERAQQIAGPAPGKLHGLKQFLVEQSPYHPQYVEVGTRFSASLNEELDFGSETQTEDQLSQLGTLPLADSILHARLLLEVSSATATRGTPVVAELTRPVYSADHQLLLPSGSRLIGQVVEARAARRLHRNGELRILFEHIEMPDGNLDETQDPAVRAGAGASGFGLAGTLIGLAARSNAVSLAFSAYGASASIYSNFLSRGREVVFPKNAPLEIGLGTTHSGGVEH